MVIKAQSQIKNQNKPEQNRWNETVIQKISHEETFLQHNLHNF